MNLGQKFAPAAPPGKDPRINGGRRPGGAGTNSFQILRAFQDARDLNVIEFPVLHKLGRQARDQWPVAVDQIARLRAEAMCNPKRRSPTVRRLEVTQYQAGPRGSLHIIFDRTRRRRPVGGRLRRIACGGKST